MNEVLILAAKRICNIANLFVPAWEVPHFSRPGWQLYLQDNKDKQYDRLLIKVPSKPRTTGRHSQNTHINGHCQQIACETGNDFDTIKLMMKRGAISQGYPFDTDPDGGVDPWSEKRLNTKQASVLIEYIHYWCAGNNKMDLVITLREDELNLL